MPSALYHSVSSPVAAVECPLAQSYKPNSKPLVFSVRVAAESVQRAACSVPFSSLGPYIRGALLVRITWDERAEPTERAGEQEASYGWCRPVAHKTTCENILSVRQALRVGGMGGGIGRGWGDYRGNRSGRGDGMGQGE